MALITSNGIGGGLSSATTSWAGGVVPVLGDKVTIAAGDIIELNASHAWGDDTSTAITVNGTLKASRLVSQTLTCRGQLITNGVLDYGQVGNVIPLGVVATILLNDSAVPWDAKWGHTVNGGASFYFNGYEKTTNTVLTSDAIGLTSFNVANATNWQVGDEICFISTSGSGNTGNREKRIISSIVGNTITLTLALTFTHLTGGGVGNLTKNVRIQTATTFKSYQDIQNTTATPIGQRQIRQISTLNLGANSGNGKYGGIWLRKINGSVQGTYLSLSDIVCENPGFYALDLYAMPDRITINNLLIYSEVWQNGIWIRQGQILTLNNPLFIGSGTGINSSWSHGGVGCIINGGQFSSSTVFLHSSAQGFIFNNTKFLSTYQAINFSWGSQAVFNNVDFGDLTTSIFRCFNTGVNALTNPIMNNCNFNYVSELFVQTSLINANDGFIATIVNMNGDLTKQMLATNAGYIERDNVLFNKSTSSIKFRPIVANKPLQHNYEISATGGKQTTVIGYLRFDAVYGTATPPTITLSGLGGVSSTFTAPATANVWHKFVLSTTPTRSGALTLNVSGSSTATTGAFYLDGVAFAPFVTNARHYGYVFDEANPSRTVNQNITKTEANAGLITGIAVDNIAKTITISAPVTKEDLYDYTQYNAQLSSNLASEVPITTGDGNNFTLTTGWKIITNSAIIGGINLTGNVDLSAVVNLSNHNITGSVTFTTAGTYNLTDSSISTVINTSVGNVIINVIGTTVITTNSGPSITIQSSAILTLTGLNAGSIVDIYDNEIVDIGNNNTLLASTNNSTTTFTYTHNGTANAVRIQVIHPLYKEIIQDFTLGNTNQSLPITQVLETND